MSQGHNIVGAAARVGAGRGGSRRRPRARALISSAVLVATVLAGAATGATASASGAKAAGKKPWTLGAVLDLTGTGAAEGQAEKAAMDFTVHQINASGGVNGHKLVVQTCDTQGTPSGGAQCASQVSGVGSHVVLLLGALPSTLGAVPHLSNVVGIAIVPVLFPKRGTDVFQASDMEGALVAPFIKAVKAAKLSTIGVIYVSEPSGTGQLDAVEGAAKAAGIKVVSVPMDPSATDVTPQIDELKAQGAQVLFSATIGTADTAVVGSYHTLGLSMPLVMGAEAVTDDFLKSLSFPIPPNLYGITTMAMGPGFSGPVTRAWAKMEVQFKKFARHPVDSEGTSGQVAVCVAAAALAGTHGGTAGRIKRYLETQRVKCLGSKLLFDKIPGLNVVSGEPTSLVQAGPSVQDGWRAVRTKL